MPVPLINTINRIDLQGAKWILVVEKDVRLVVHYGHALTFPGSLPTPLIGSILGL